MSFNFRVYRKELVSFGLLVLFSALLLFMGANDILDTKIFYTSAQATELIKSLTAAGVENYKRIALVDLLLFIPTYTVLLFLLAKRFLPEKFLFASFIPAVLDIGETLAIYLYLTNTISIFPEWVGYLTLLKWLSVYAIALTIGANLYKKIRADINIKY